MKGRRFLLKLNNDKNNSFTKFRLMDGKGILFLFTFLLFTLFSNTIFGQACTLVNLPNNLKNGLVAYYPFCGNSNDISGNNNALQAFGLTATTDRFGTSASAYSFSNTQTVVTSYLKATNPTPFAKNTYTISAWFNTNQFYPSVGGLTYNYQSIVGYAPQHYSWGPAYSLQLLNGDNTTLTASQWTGANLFQGVSTNTGTITTNQWYHAVVTYDGTNIKMFRDGVLVGSRAATIDFANQVQFLIGANGDGPNPGGLYGGFNGKLDDIGFWDRALDVCEVTQLFNLTATNPQPSTSFNPLSDTTNFAGRQKLLDAGAGYNSYSWSTGETTRSINAKTNNTFKVTVVDNNGCVSTDSTFLNLLDINVYNNDSTICKGDSVLLTSSSYAIGKVLPTQFNDFNSLADFTDNSQGTVALTNDGVAGNAITMGYPSVIRTLKTDYSFGTYEIDAKAAGNTANQGFILLARNSDYANPNDVITVESIPLGTDDPRWGLYYNGIKIAGVIGSHPATYPNWYHIKVRYTPDSLRLWIDNTLLYETANPVIPANPTGSVMISTFATSKYDNFSYTPYVVNKSVLWSTGATTESIYAKPSVATKYTVTVSNGYTTIKDSVTLSVNEIVGFNPLTNITSQCASNVVLNAGSGFTSYQWSTGSNTITTTVNKSGNYKVTVTNSDGCSTTDSTFVSLLQANILNNDTIVCKNGSATLKIDSLINGSSFSSLYQLPTSIKNGLVAYYPFNGNPNDVSGNNNNGVITSVTSTTDRFGTANNAYQFSGGNIAVPMTSELAMTGDRTFSCWFKANGNQTGGRIYENTYLNSGIGLYNGNKLDAWHCSNGQSRNVTNITFGTINEWHHLVYVADATNSLGKVYIDGALSGTMSATSSACPNNWLGAYMRFGLGASGEVFNGSLDDIGIWNRTLTATEIRQLYNNNISVTWSTGATTNTIVINPTQTTTYTATLSDGITSCQEQIVVTVPTDPTITASGSTAICDGSSVQLTSSSGTGNAWYKNGQPILVGGNGQQLTVSQAGVYSLTATTTIYNCVNTSTNSIIVTINPLPTIGFNTLPVSGVVCRGEDITLNGTGGVGYNWTGGAIDGVAFPAIQSGTYTVTGTDINGCSNTASANIIVNNASAVSIAMTPSAGIICARDSVTLLATGSVNYTWDRGIINGQKFNPTATRVYTVIGTDANGCKDTVTKTVEVANLPNLSITMVPESGIICLNDSVNLSATGAVNYRWSQGIINGQKFNPTTTGVYTVVGTDVNGCSNTISTTVQVNPLPVVTIGLFPASGVICLKDSATLTATGAENYTWDNGVVNGQKFNPSSTRSYTVIGTDVNGCTATASKNIQVLPLPNVWVSMVPDEAIVCANTNVVLSANGAVSYSWDNGVVNGQTFNPMTTGNYTVVGTGANGCKNTVVKNIEVLPQPDIKATATNTAPCEGENIKLSASGGIGYTWSDNVNDGVSFTPTKTQKYYVSGFDINGCQNTDSIIINVNKIPVLNIRNSIVCDGAPSQLVAIVNSGIASDYNYSWFAPNYVKLPDTENNITVFKAGLYSAIAVNKNTNCASIPTESLVTFNPIPVVGAITTATKTVLVDNEFTLIANPTAVKQPINYSWKLSDPTKAIIISGNQNVLLKAIGKGKLDVTYHITDGNNCISKESEVLQMTINQTAIFVVPTAFSPNNDGLNDYLNIIAKSSLTGLNYFKIFNRYGVLVYDTKEIKYGWDGRFNGVMQEPDIYYWIAEYTTIDGETIKTSGQTVLIK